MRRAADRDGLCTRLVVLRVACLKRRPFSPPSADEGKYGERKRLCCHGVRLRVFHAATVALRWSARKRLI